MTSFIRSSIETFECLSFSDLQLRGITVPDFQRFLKTEHVNNIYEYFVDCINKHKEPILMGVIVICTNKKDDTNWLIDGNHRYHAIKKLYENYGYNMKCVCNTIEVFNKEEMEDLFNKINKSIGVPEVPTGVSLGLPNKIIKQLKIMYPLLIKSGNSGRVNRPHIHENDLIEKIGEASQFVNITIENFLEKLQEFNHKLKTGTRLALKRRNNESMIKIDELCNDAHTKGGLLVGMLSIEKNWVMQMYGLAIPKKEENINRIAIPNDLRQELWHKYKKPSKTSQHIIVECNWCKSELNMNSMVCDHFPISVKNGGTNILSNLVPSCISCNSSRGCKDE